MLFLHVICFVARARAHLSRSLRVWRCYPRVERSNASGDRAVLATRKRRCCCSIRAPSWSSSSECCRSRTIDSCGANPTTPRSSRSRCLKSRVCVCECVSECVRVGWMHSWLIERSTRMIAHLCNPKKENLTAKLKIVQRGQAQNMASIFEFVHVPPAPEKEISRDREWEERDSFKYLNDRMLDEGGRGTVDISRTRSMNRKLIAQMIAAHAPVSSSADTSTTTTTTSTATSSTQETTTAASSNGTDGSKKRKLTAEDVRQSKRRAHLLACNPNLEDLHFVRRPTTTTRHHERRTRCSRC